MTDPAFLDAGDLRLAYRLARGSGPALLFLPGYASDMSGTKALALEQWAQAQGREYCRFDYAGCGESEGAFEDQTLERWRDDILAMIDRVVTGPVILVGSSMGGWLMLLAAALRPDRVAGLVGIAAAPDFTDWGFTQEQKLEMLSKGRLEEPSDYSDQPTVTTRAFWTSGEANRVMIGPIAFDGPVVLLQGQRDPDVPWERALGLAERLRSAEVQTWLVKDGDHRLSRERDIALLIRAVEEVTARCSSSHPSP